jgi:hypothetical protein
MNPARSWHHHNHIVVLRQCIFCRNMLVLILSIFPQQAALELDDFGRAEEVTRRDDVCALRVAIWIETSD